MKILFLNNVRPHTNHDRAGNVVLYEMIREFAADSNHTVGFQLVSPHDAKPPTEDEIRGVQSLGAMGVTMAPEITLPPPPRSRPGLLKLLAPQPRDFFPYHPHRDLILKALEKAAPDWVIIPWSEWLTALCAEYPGKKFAYYGNPDPKVGRCFVQFQRRNRLASPLRLHAMSRMLDSLERIHLKMMARYELLGNVAANDAEYYRQAGHPNAFYIQNIWIDRFQSMWEKTLPLRKNNGKAVIIGNVGKLFATANTHGLEVLGRDLLPALRREMRGIDYEIHLLGQGQPHPALRHYFDSPEVRILGFVPDIDRSLMEADVFLCMNNASEFKVGHTRYLHAWSVGGCVVAHRDCRLSMPEIVHEKNALLGGDCREIASHIRRLVDDPALHQRLCRDGYETFRTHFSAPAVVRKMREKMDGFSKTQS
ncbi:MAG: glycosyltransferase [Verrucomicrobiae bacterium]|nr:glycosyltransferase [Verrucomicrobiae bacterium]